MSTQFEYTDRLRKLIDEKHSVLTSLRELADVQVEQAFNSDMAVLVSVLARKQPLMDELSRIQEELSTYTLDDPDSRVWKSPADRLACRAVAQSCDQLLKNILQLEQQAIDELSDRRDAVAVQLQDGRDGMSARSAYFTNAAIDSSSLDLSSM